MGDSTGTDAGLISGLPGAGRAPLEGAVCPLTAGSALRCQHGWAGRCRGAG